MTTEPETREAYLLRKIKQIGDGYFPGREGLEAGAEAEQCQCSPLPLGEGLGVRVNSTGCCEYLHAPSTGYG